MGRASARWLPIESADFVSIIKVLWRELLSTSTVRSSHLVATCGTEGTSMLNHLAKMARQGDKAIGVPA